jgi:hypothetical protein
MKKASNSLISAFYDGLKRDREMRKHSLRLLRVLAWNDGDIKKTIVQMVMAPDIQAGFREQCIAAFARIDGHQV